jgi:hypothetical protein
MPPAVEPQKRQLADPSGKSLWQVAQYIFAARSQNTLRISLATSTDRRSQVFSIENLGMTGLADEPLL